MRTQNPKNLIATSNHEAPLNPVNAYNSPNPEQLAAVPTMRIKEVLLHCKLMIQRVDMARVSSDRENLTGEEF